MSRIGEAEKVGKYHIHIRLQMGIMLSSQIVSSNVVSQSPLRQFALNRASYCVPAHHVEFEVISSKSWKLSLELL